MPLLNENHQEDEQCPEPLIPGLPDEIAEICLHHLPYPYQALVRSVSPSWNKLITDPGFIVSKKLSLSLPNLFVFAFDKSTKRIQWQALDLRSGRWFVLPSMPCPTSVCPSAFACTSIPRQGKLFVLGGVRSDSEKSMDTTFVYRTSTNQWSISSPMLTPRSFFTAGNVNNKIIAVGGSDLITAVECYNSDNESWASAAEMRVGLNRYDSAVLGSRMYVTEGWTWPFMFSPRAHVYNPEKDTWQDMSEGMKDGWTGLSAVVEDKLFVISEHGNCPMKVYDPDNDTWRYVGGDRFPREAMERPYAVGGGEGKVYVVSCGLDVAIGRVIECDANKGQWNVEWEVVGAPPAFRDFCPTNCQVLYA